MRVIQDFSGNERFWGAGDHPRRGEALWGGQQGRARGPGLATVQR